MTSLAAPLEGVRVIDLSRVVSGPLCGRMLADMGAEVVKVEPPTGDVTRTVPPDVGGFSPYFAQMNAGKRNVCVDLKAPGGVEVVRRLAAASDVLIENFRPGVLAGLGLGAAALLGDNPRLVYCSITGWGQEGPWRNRQAYAPLVHAQAGMLELSSRLRGRPAEQELHVHGDTYPALVAANAVLAALLQRARTGLGQHLDIAMAEVLLYVNEWTAVELQDEVTDPGAFDIWTHWVLPLGDGTAVTLVGNPTRNFASWVQALGGDPALLADERFASPSARDAHVAEVRAVLTELTARFADFAAIEAALADWPLMVGELRSIAEVARGPWAAHRHLLADALPGLPLPAAPWRSATSAVGVAGPPARRGEHNREVLADVAGFAPDEIDDLLASGALLAEQAPPTAHAGAI